MREGATAGQEDFSETMNVTGGLQMGGQTSGEEQSKKDQINMSRIPPVPGYPDNENMWVKLTNVEKTETNKNQF